ncbi:MAG: hypothetical protein HYX76_09085 [Acidobacteria bacterium]|nr:hypothetical protein [Acidobacteriota bacterium]
MTHNAIKSIALAGAAALVATAAACAFDRGQNGSPTSPSGISAQAFEGTWSSSAATGLPPLGSCNNLQYTVTSANPATKTMSVTFTASCGGGVTLSGSGTGTMANNGTVNWSASGTATGPGSTSCPFSLTGTAVMQGPKTVVVTYSGTTCFGPVSGSETLTKP